MLSKATIKRIRALEQKKFRRQTGLFVAEGPKVVGDLLAAMPAHEIFATEEWLCEHQSGNIATAGVRSRANIATPAITEVSEDELRRLSFQQHPQQVLATFPIPATLSNGQLSVANHLLSIALDGVQDPGNLGTIIRIADWFGIGTIFCSPNTADAYAPKVVQATMGSLTRVHITYCDLAQLLEKLPADFPVYGTLLDGDDIYTQPLTTGGLIVMGNEGKGLSPEVARRVNRQLLIPSYPADRPTADSLNVAMATAIVCAEFRRQEQQNKK